MTTRFTHLLSLSDDIGTFEHAEYRTRRREHGYCTDDVARVVIAVCGETARSVELRELESRSLRFLIEAQVESGRTRNRRAPDGTWFGSPSTDDCWGRSLWGLGVAAAHGSTASGRRAARSTFEQCCVHDSTSPRALAFATLGAEHIVTLDGSTRALMCVQRFASWFDGRETEGSWPWPEARLAYANASICEALIVAGARLDRIDLVRSGLELLDWLVEHDSRSGHLSPTPVGGAGPDDVSGRFDQQPIEVAAFASAARAAFDATYDRRWLDVIDTAGRWFDGDNDIGAVMWDPVTGAGFDGLGETGVNENCGAESTLAVITTMQQRALISELLA